MGRDDGQERRAGKLVRKFGTVAAAAAALLAEGSGGAHDSGMMEDLINRHDPSAAVSRGAAEPDGDRPPPLVLTPSQVQPDWLLARRGSHSSHSSHSSHRSHSSHVSGSFHSSHYSASSHSSHYSSSVGSVSGPTTRRTPSAPSPAPAPADWPAAAPREPAKDPAPATPVNPQPAPKVEAPPAVDRHNPLQRYELVTLGTYQGIQKAYIKDLLDGNASLLKIGESIGDCTLVEITPERDSVRLKPAQGADFSIKRGRAQK